MTDQHSIALLVSMISLYEDIDGGFGDGDNQGTVRVHQDASIRLTGNKWIKKPALSMCL